MSDEKSWRKIMWCNIIAATCFILMLVIVWASYLYQKGKQDGANELRQEMLEKPPC